MWLFLFRIIIELRFLNTHVLGGCVLLSSPRLHVYHNFKPTEFEGCIYARVTGSLSLFNCLVLLVSSLQHVMMSRMKYFVRLEL